MFGCRVWCFKQLLASGLPSKCIRSSYRARHHHVWSVFGFSNQKAAKLSGIESFGSASTAKQYSSTIMSDVDFGDLLVVRATDADFDDMLNFMLKDFLYNEPLNRSIGLDEPDANKLFRDIIRSGISSSLSYVLRSQQGELAALRLATILDRPDQSQKIDFQTLNDNRASGENNNVLRPAPGDVGPKAQQIVKLLNELENKIWILVNPRIRRLLNWSVVSVSSQFTRSGLATKLLTYNLDEAKLMGCQGCVTDASAYKSQKLFQKLGYEVIHEIRHDEWLDDNGQQIFKCDDLTDSIKLQFKHL